MNKKRLLFGAILVFIFILIAGCSSSTQSPASSEPAKEAPKETAAKSKLDEIKERGKLIAGVKYDTNLFGLKDPADNQVKGFDVDIAKELAKKIFGDESKLELKEVTSKTRIAMLKNGEIDMIAATMTITEERWKEVDFSSVYFEAGQSLLVPQNSPITGIQDLKGKTVLVVKGSTSTKNIREKTPDANVKEYENYAEAFTALKAGKGDTLTTDNSILLGMIKQDASFKMVGGLFTSEPYGLAIAKGNDEFLQYVNDFLAELKQSGKYDEIYKKWFGEAPKK